MERYSNYKDSGVKWLGEIPGHWEVRRLGGYFSERRTKVSDIEFPALSVTKNGIFPQLENVAKTKDGDNRKLVRAGDFVINSRSDRKGSSGVSSLDGSVSLINIVLEPREGVEPSFCNYLLKTNDFIEEFYRNGRGIVADLWTTRYDEMKLIKIAFPPLSEQRAMSAYLDRATAQLDAAIAREQQMIDLLNERKRIIIQQAVTKGLDTNAKMKSSSLSWLGEIPETWNVKRLGFCAWIRARLGWRGLKANEYVDAGYPFLSAFNIFNNKMDWSKVFYINKQRYDESPEIKLVVGDILFVKDGAGIGKCARIDELPLGEATANGSLAFITPNSELNYRYLYYYLISKSFKQYTELLLTGMGVPHFTQGAMKKVKIPIPPLEEQSLIADVLDKEISRYDKAIEHIENVISLLQERKQILIREVVTGKIKVS